MFWKCSCCCAMREWWIARSGFDPWGHSTLQKSSWKGMLNHTSLQKHLDEKSAFANRSHSLSQFKQNLHCGNVIPSQTKNRSNKQHAHIQCGTSKWTEKKKNRRIQTAPRSLHLCLLLLFAYTHPSSDWRKSYFFFTLLLLCVTVPIHRW